MIFESKLFLCFHLSHYFIAMVIITRKGQKKLKILLHLSFEKKANFEKKEGNKN